MRRVYYTTQHELTSGLKFNGPRFDRPAPAEKLASELIDEPNVLSVVVIRVETHTTVLERISKA